MVVLKNTDQTFQDDNFMESFLINEDADCVLYSSDGKKFNIHKEIFYQTRLMRNVLLTHHGTCFKNLEIFCPCSESELESIVNFLYSGKISFDELNDVAKILNNLTKIFGFHEKLFTVEDCSMLTEAECKRKDSQLNDFSKKRRKFDYEHTPFTSNDVGGFITDQAIAGISTVVIPFNPDSDDSKTCKTISNPDLDDATSKTIVIPFDPDIDKKLGSDTLIKGNPLKMGVFQ